MRTDCVFRREGAAAPTTTRIDNKNCSVSHLHIKINIMFRLCIMLESGYCVYSTQWCRNKMGRRCRLKLLDHFPFEVYIYAIFGFEAQRENTQ